MAVGECVPFPAFRPRAAVDRLFGNPKARIVCLERSETVGGVCGRVSRRIYDRKPRWVREPSGGDVRIYLEAESHRVLCQSCAKVKQEKLAWFSDNPFYTKRFVFLRGPALSDLDDLGRRPRVAPGL